MKISFWHRLDQILETFFSLWILTSCASCKRDCQGLMCASCVSAIQRVRNTDEAVQSYGFYEGVLKDLICQFKYENKFSLAKPLASLLVNLVPKGVDCLVAVPLHSKKLRSRKYNQSHLLVREIAFQTRIPDESRVLRKTILSMSQKGLSKTERILNIRDTFSVSLNLWGKHVLMIDDVLTTGATVMECKRILKKAGAAKVSVLTLARSMMASSLVDYPKKVHGHVV